MLLTAINYLGVQEGGALQAILTGLKVGAIAVIILLGYVLVKGLPGGPGSPCCAHRPSLRGLFRGGDGGSFLGLRRLELLHVCGRGGERPERNMPLALILGTMAVM